MNRLVEKVKQMQMPHTYVLLISFMIIAAIASYIVPAGEFERVVIADRQVIDPSTFSYVENKPQNLFDLLTAFPKGFARSQHVSFFLFVVGGVYHVINQSDAINAGLNRVVKALKGKEMMVIPVLLFILGLAGATIGMSEETILFVAICVSLARAMGYDALVGLGIITLGSGLGFTAGFLNPFSVGVAQSIAELPLFSGIELRLVLFVVLWLTTSIFLMRYARSVKNNQSTSLIYEEEIAARQSDDYLDIGEVEVDFSWQQQLILATLALGFIIVAYGVIQLGWYITEISAVFIGVAITAGFIQGFSPSELADTFIDGAKDMMYAALIVGIAQSLIVVLEDAYLLDSLIYSLTNVISSLPSVFSALGMYIVQIIINFFISSGSGQAAVTMPIMVPLGDALNVSRQTTVLAYQLGNGFLDSAMPMSGILMANLAIAGIPYKKWLKFVMPLMIAWLVIGAVFVVAAHQMGYGPF